MSRRGVDRRRRAIGTRWRFGGRLVVATVLVLAFAVSVAAAAGPTTVTLEPEASEVDVGSTVTVDLVVTDADGGVGAFIAEVGLGNPNVATITDVSFDGSPPLSDVDLASEGEAARFGAILLDTDQQGSVTIATVAVRADATGSTGVSLTIDPLADEQGEPYEVAMAGTALEVAGTGTPVPPPEDGDEPDFGDDGLDLGGSDVGLTATATASTPPTPRTTATGTPTRASTASEVPTETVSTTATPTESNGASTATESRRTGTGATTLGGDPSPTGGTSSSIPVNVQLGVVLFLGAFVAALVGLRLRR